ncbi:non-ribosomal peptide synthetase [Pseudoalteromonas sp. R3]|uniref:non-ribosomal peptide synthetase n=1 Tax=Pseudoalteromonas sp. R3 TaxID=1709477 RepID=UPI0006B5D447|nr:non-ribosomal peptide synthetase [Pseudoalteromonas sp. R3]AZZ97455.1 non-ribosomal peptide synthase [Pseudoalteromonas sp. R3]
MDIQQKLSALSPEKRAKLLQQLAEKNKAAKAVANDIPVVAKAAQQRFPLSHEQQRIWFLSRYEPESPEYSIPQLYQSTQPLDLDSFTQAVEQTLADHDILRCRFDEDQGEAHQVILSMDELKAQDKYRVLPIVDFSERTLEQGKQDALREIEEDCERAFDLTREGIFRTRLFKLAGDHYIWYVNVHHIGFDAWSHNLFIRYVNQTYAALSGKGEQPAKPQASYIDYACWQRMPEQEEALKSKLQYWLKQLEAVPPIELYCDRPRPAERTFNGDACTLPLAENLAARVRAFCEQRGITTYNLLLCVLRILLHKYTRQSDFAIGTLIANREKPTLAQALGFFTNTLAFRTQVEPELSFTQMLDLEKQTLLDAYANQDVSFEKLVDELNPTRDLSRAAIFQVMLILDNTTSSMGNPASSGQQPLFAPMSSENKTSKLDLTFYFSQSDTLSGFIEFNTDLFDMASIERLAGHFALLLERVIAAPEQKIEQFSLLSQEQQQTITEQWQDGPQHTFDHQPLHQLVSAQVNRTHNASAIIDGDLTLSYQALENRANALANHLYQQGVRAGDFVAMATHRNASMIVAMLAILKTGAAYIPLDTDYPKERVSYMLDNAQTQYVITNDSLSEKFSQYSQLTLITPDGLLSAAAPQPDADIALSFDVANDLDLLAYVIFTSGSTGNPKGVMIPHHSVSNFLFAMQQAPGMRTGEKLLACTTICFDIAVLEIFMPLISGATVVLAQREQVLDPTQLIALIDRHDIDVMQATPSTWRMMLELGWQGKRDMRILCGGEALPPELAEDLLLKSSSFWNLYGPTEATVWCSRHRIESGDGETGAVTIGKPIENVTMLLLDSQMQAVPPGVPGELYVTGDCLARGYLNRDDLTDEAFISHDYKGQTLRLYRTKDLAKYDPSGKIIFLGRADDQVKVRGYRIELGEIESTLNSHNDIEQAVCQVHTFGSDKKLIAYYSSAAGELEQEQLVRHLKKKLPEYMVPSLFVYLKQIPLTPNGKLNRRALPVPDMSAMSSKVPYCAPENDLQATLCRLYSEILKTPQVGIDDDFFSLGGDSLLVIRLVAKAKPFDIEITPKQVFQHKTVRALAEASLTTQILRQVEPVVGPVAMTPAQKHFLELSHTHPEYHTLGVFLLPRDKDFDISAIEQSLLHVMAQHDTLRMRLTTDASGQHQLIGDELPARAPLTLASLEETQERTLAQQVNYHIFDTATAMDLANGPLFRAILYPASPGEKPMLFLIGHFMLADIGSWHTIIDDFETCYRQISRDEPLELPKKGTSFAQWVEKLTQWSQSEDALKQRDYWMLEERKHAADLPKDFPDGVNSMASSQSVYVQFDEAETTLLTTEVTKVTGAQIDSVLLTSIVYAFMRECDSNCLMIDLLGHGREPLFDDVDLSRTVGWFNTIYPAFLSYGDNRSPVGAMKYINEQLRAIPNGGIGYGVLRYLAKDKELIDHFNTVPEPQVFFNYFGHDNVADLRVLQREDGFGGYGLDKETKRLRPLAVGVYIKQNQLSVRWEFSSNQFEEAKIARLAEHCEACLKEILATYNQL